jgi:uncharacterized cupredoxin-like copper-binding protein
MKILRTLAFLTLTSGALNTPQCKAIPTAQEAAAAAKATADAAAAIGKGVGALVGAIGVIYASVKTYSFLQDFDPFGLSASRAQAEASRAQAEALREEIRISGQHQAELQEALRKLAEKNKNQMDTLIEDNRKNQESLQTTLCQLKEEGRRDHEALVENNRKNQEEFEKELEILKQDHQKKHQILVAALKAASAERDAAQKTLTEFIVQQSEGTQLTIMNVSETIQRNLAYSTNLLSRQNMQLGELICKNDRNSQRRHEELLNASWRHEMSSSTPSSSLLSYREPLAITDR